MTRIRVVRPMPASWSRVALTAAAVFVAASGLALGASMAIGIR
jgi:hypothetical protein